MNNNGAAGVPLDNLRDYNGKTDSTRTADSIENVEDNIVEAQDLLEKSVDKIKDLDNALHKHKNANTSLAAELKKAKFDHQKEKNALKNDVRTLLRAHDGVKRDLDLNAEIVERQMAAIKKHQETIQAKDREHSEGIDVYTKHLQELQAGRDDAHQQTKTMVEELEELKKENATLQKEKQNLCRYKKAYNRVKKEHDLLTKEHSQLNTEHEINSKKKQHAENVLKHTKDDHRRQVERLNLSIKKLEQYIGQLSGENISGEITSIIATIKKEIVEIEAPTDDQ
ncbi:MAG: hypothetical protein LBJ45_00020 [Holosporaceae bacterium]|nr:hypothetical protein [Holosporaceae bacterium]